MTASLRVLCVTLAAAGCGTQPSPPGAQADEPPARRPSEPAIGSNAPPPRAVPVDPTQALVATAFGGTAPSFPLLARDGREAAMGIASPVGHSTVSTYRVARFSSWTTT